MAPIIVDIYVVDSGMRDGKVVERPVGSEVLEGEHVDRANEIALPVIRQKRPCGERAGINVERPEAGKKSGNWTSVLTFLKAPPGGAFSGGVRAPSSALWGNSGGRREVRVASSSTPVTGKPCCAWYWRNAAFVRGPSTPSMGPG